MVQRSTFQAFLIDGDQILIKTRRKSVTELCPRIKKKKRESVNEVVTLEFWTRLLLKFVSIRKFYIIICNCLLNFIFKILQ